MMVWCLIFDSRTDLNFDLKFQVKAVTKGGNIVKKPPVESSSEEDTSSDEVSNN